MGSACTKPKTSSAFRRDVGGKRLRVTACRRSSLMVNRRQLSGRIVLRRRASYTIRRRFDDTLHDYASISEILARLTDNELAALVAKAPLLHAGVGGRSVLVTIDSTPIFVKQLPLTDLERRQEHVQFYRQSL